MSTFKEYWFQPSQGSILCPSRAEEHCPLAAIAVCAQQYWMCTRSVKQPHNKCSPKD